MNSLTPVAPVPPRLFTLILLTALSTVTLNMFVPSMVNIATDLNSDYSVVSLSVGIYLAAMTVVQLVVGPLSDRVGRRPVLLGALLLFAGASIGCAVAPNVQTFLFFRMFQSIMVAGYVLSMAVVRDTTNEQDSASRIGYISMAMAMAPLLGPVLGGALDTQFGWRSIFYVLAGAGVALFIWCLTDLDETNSPAVASTDSNNETIWDLLRERSFWAYSICTTFSTANLYIFLTGAPLIAETEFGISTTEMGLYLATGTAGFMFGSFLSGRYAATTHPIRMMFAGRIITIIGLCIAFLFSLLGYLPVWLFFASITSVGIGNGLTIPSSNARTMSIRPLLAGGAAGVSGAVIVAVGAPLSMLTGILLPDEHASSALLILMLLVTIISLLAVVWAQRIEKRHNTVS